MADTPYGPLRPEEAVNLRRFLFLVVDAGQGPKGDWSQTLEGPTGKELVGAVVDVIVDANAHAELHGLRGHHAQLARRHGALALQPEARGGGAPARRKSGPWNCRDLKITVARVSLRSTGRRARRDAQRGADLVHAAGRRPSTNSRSAGGDALQGQPGVIRSF